MPHMTFASLLLIPFDMEETYIVPQYPAKFISTIPEELSLPLSRIGVTGPENISINVKRTFVDFEVF